ncbi:Flp pilus assembly complex ATPase component TadA [Agrobacterium rubi]|nr:Flp pilus assembly complex ATPase component TadA [Agrobacterium rubi]NTF23637.1 Flp pilus assembly complex ATPase component TadA [Agrobacterium rubi]
MDKPIHPEAPTTQQGESFAYATRNALRHYPDVIMIGEVIDLETRNAVIEAERTGHLTSTTMQTRSAI